MIPIIEFPRGALLAEQVDVQENIFVSPEIDGRVPVSAAADAQPPSTLPQTPPEDTSAVPDKPVVPEVNKTPGVTIINKKGKFKDYWVIKNELSEIVCILLGIHCPVLPEDVLHQRTTRWRIAGTHEIMHNIQDSWTKPSEAHGHVEISIGSYWTGEIIFMMSPQLPSGTNSEVLLTQWVSRQARQVLQQVQKLDRVSSKYRPFDIIEIFSPPRFDQQAAVRAHQQIC